MRLLTFLVSLVLVIAAGYAGTAYYVGGTVADAVAAYQRRLLEMEGVSVRQLVYERRLLGGDIVYDVAWRPGPGHPVGALLSDLTPGAASGELRLAGKVPVRHGPWVGVLAPARAEWQSALPDQVRPLLPKYPGQAPWLSVDAIMDWSGAVTANVGVVEYAGPVGRAGEPLLGNVVLEGLRGRIDVTRGATAATVDFTVAKLLGVEHLSTLQLKTIRLAGTARLTAPETVQGTFTVGTLSFEDKGAEAARLTAGPLRVATDVRREWSYIWSGRSSFGLEDLKLDVDGRQGTLASLVVDSDLERKGERFDTSGGIELGASRFAGMELPGLLFKVALRNVEAAPVNDLAEAIRATMERGIDGLPALFEVRLPRLGSQLLAAGPVLAIDPVALSVRKPRDIALVSTVGVPAGTQVPPDRPDLIADIIESQMSFTASLGAIEDVFVLAARGQAALDGKLALDPAEEAATRERFARVRRALVTQPLLTVDTDRLGVTMRLARGSAEVNGRKMELAAITGALEQMGEDLVKAFMLDAPRRAPPAAAPATHINPVADATPAFGHLVLGGNAPRPRPVRLKAGGDTLLRGELGEECIGHIDARQPDLVLTWGGGTPDILIRAESDDDTVLVVKGPDGRWLCNDDGNGAGFDPELHITRPQRGRYAIWVATTEDAAAEATVSVTAAGR